MTTLAEAAASLRANGSVLRVGDVIRQWEKHDHDLCLLTGPQVDGWSWPALCFPTNAPGEAFQHEIPGDFAELAALEGRIVYPVDPWSTWPS
jgi:hypothetical protein